MLLKNLFLIAFIGAFSFLQAQPGETAKKLGVRELNLKNIASNNIELNISKTGDNINVTARGIKSTGVRGCTTCNVSGIITFAGGAEEAFVPKGATNRTTGGGAQTTAVGVKVVLAKEPGGSPVKTTTLNADGSFSFTGVPKGTYQLKLGDNVIATGYKIGGE